MRSVIGPDALRLVDADRKWTQREALSHEKELEKMSGYWPEDTIESDLLKKRFSIRNGIAFPSGDPWRGIFFDWEKWKNSKYADTIPRQV